VAAAVGLSLAGIYAITAALWHRVPNPPFLRWTVLPALPTALAAAAIGLLAPRRPHIPAPTWLDFLHTPLATTTLGAAGIFGIQYGHTAHSTAEAGPATAALYIGAALLGIATAWTLPIHLTHQIIAGALLTPVAVILAVGNATATFATLYALAAATRWITRLAQMLRPYR
jgi:hypothetical protein